LPPEISSHTSSCRRASRGTVDIAEMHYAVADRYGRPCPASSCLGDIRTVVLPAPLGRFQQPTCARPVTCTSKSSTEAVAKPLVRPSKSIHTFFFLTDRSGHGNFDLRGLGSLLARPSSSALRTLVRAFDLACVLGREGPRSIPPPRQRALMRRPSRPSARDVRLLPATASGVIAVIGNAPALSSSEESIP